MTESTDPPDPKRRLDHPAVLAADLPDWRLLAGRLRARFHTKGFATGLALVDRIGAAAEAVNHHPDVTLTWPIVDVTLSSHDVGGVTSRDVELARVISRLAAEAGVPADPGAVSSLELALDTADRAGVLPFWRALLGYDDGAGEDELVDPGGLLPPLWFQTTDAHDTPRQRFHLDVWVPYDVAQARIRDAIAAGGTLVSDTAAPSFWVLADAEGNRACVCTAQDRG